MSKKKGTRAERELFHMFWDASWAATRAAGSGSTTLPSPDLIVSNGKRCMAIECKSLKSKVKYFDKDELGQLKIFSKRFGAEAWLGIRFDKLGWFFIKADKIRKSKGSSFSVSLKHALRKGLRFNELVNLAAERH